MMLVSNDSYASALRGHVHSTLLGGGNANFHRKQEAPARSKHSKGCKGWKRRRENGEWRVKNCHEEFQCLEIWMGIIAVEGHPPF